MRAALHLYEQLSAATDDKTRTRLIAEAIELLETQNQRVEDRRADLVARMRGANGEEFLLHTEISNNNDADMPLRMLRYYTDIRLAGHTGPLRQCLI